MEHPQPVPSTAIPQKAESSAEAQYQPGSRSEGENVPGLEREKSWTEVQRKKKSGARNEGKVRISLIASNFLSMRRNQLGVADCCLIIFELIIFIAESTQASGEFSNRRAEF